MFEFLLKNILPSYRVVDSDENCTVTSNNKTSDEICTVTSNNKTSDEIWLDIFHAQLAVLNRLTDEAQQNLNKDKYAKNMEKYNQKHLHK